MSRIVPFLVILALFAGIEAGCTREGASVQPPSPSGAPKAYRLRYIKDLRLSYTTAKKQFVYNENQTSAAFPENTSGVVLRLSGDSVPEGLIASVSWYFVKDRPQLLCSQSVSAAELNRLQYIDISMYQHDTELPAGQYEVVISDNRNSEKEKLSFLIK
jgi:hypothetical protein